MIRLFTSGTHKGLTFSNEDIESIQTSTHEQASERLPIVLGHPKNDLPIIGFLPKDAISIYDEGDRRSIGFDRDKAILSDESMEILRKTGNNKISVRLRDGQITHIGLVKNAAVEENNNQDFSSDWAIYHTYADFQEKPNIIKTIKNVFNMTKEQTEQQPSSDFTALEAKVDTVVTSLQQLITSLSDSQKRSRKESVKADFSSTDFSHLTDEQVHQAEDFASTIEDPDECAKFISLLKSTTPKPQVVQGSVTAEFSTTEKRTTEGIISQQIKQLQ